MVDRCFVAVYVIQHHEEKNQPAGCQSYRICHTSSDFIRLSLLHDWQKIARGTSAGLGLGGIR